MVMSPTFHKRQCFRNVGDHSTNATGSCQSAQKCRLSINCCYNLSHAAAQDSTRPLTNFSSQKVAIHHAFNWASYPHGVLKFVPPPSASISPRLNQSDMLFMCVTTALTESLSLRRWIMASMECPLPADWSVHWLNYPSFLQSMFLQQKAKISTTLFQFTFICLLRILYMCWEGG
jgi:hypothetical protein